MSKSFTVIASLVISFGAVAQESAPKPKISDAPLSSEQIAVYRAVLADYLKGSQDVLNLAEVTEPFDGAESGCLRGLDTGASNRSAPVVHRMDASLVADTKVVLVDPGRQHQRVEENDPQKLIRKAIDDHQKLTDEQLDDSVKSAFASGLFTLSEIAFDKEHRHAAVSYSFVCGGLCGNGDTLLLKKVGQSWKVAKRCGRWVS
jgi:hypothetical protein